MQLRKSLCVVLEALNCTPLPIPNMPWVSSIDRPKSANPVTMHSLRVWDLTKIPFRVQSSHLLLQSFLSAPTFPLAYESRSRFGCWRDRGVHAILDMLNAQGQVVPFPEIQQRYVLSGGEVFRYLQVRHYVVSVVGDRFSLTTLTMFERYCSKDPHARMVISHLYAHLLTPPQDCTQDCEHKYMLRWTLDLGHELGGSDWSAIWGLLNPPR